MRQNKLLSVGLGVVLCIMLSETAFSQIQISPQTPAPLEADSAPIPIADPAGPSDTGSNVLVFTKTYESDQSPVREKAMKDVRDLIRSSDVGPLRKIGLLTKLRRPVVADAVCDRVIAKAMDAGAITYTVLENDDGTSDVEVKIDQDFWAELLKILLPLILEWLGSF